MSDTRYVGVVATLLAGVGIAYLAGFAGWRAFVVAIGLGAAAVVVVLLSAVFFAHRLFSQIGTMPVARDMSALANHAAAEGYEVVVKP
jgi:hypothetical protein